jgi:hypothetical protein
MFRMVSMAVALSAAALIAVPSPSLAAKKRYTSTGESCLGGGCLGVGANPDRTRQDTTAYYKRSKTKKTKSPEH